MVTTTQILLGVGAAVVGYVVYFDQRRQRDPAFRRKLRANRAAAASIALAEQEKAAQAEDAAVRAAMAALGLDDDAPPPTTEEEKQRYLTRQLQLGEQFLNQGKRR
ncbi:hypothetical protein HK100_005605 [Physocladia obscura]|uniref:Uncharacterized protein n=1 Tax=Physocladia obscura TaxID=109957 RepID=A0AAD5XC81_9FUNG|nr:hypothetical protein HK100_005605 [Physocladia obscura]